jgi:hypothetical protein
MYRRNSFTGPALRCNSVGLSGILRRRCCCQEVPELILLHLSELEVGMVRFCSEVPPCAAAHYEGIPEDCQRCVLASFCAFAKVSFSSLRQYRQSFPENVAGLPGHVHAVTSEARKVLLWYALVRSQWPREQDPQTLPKSLRSQGTSAQRRPLPLYPPPFKRWVRGRLTSIFRADITITKTLKSQTYPWSKP